MRALFIEKHADGLLDIALRAQRLGHRALYYCGDYDQHRQPIGRGLIERVPEWRSHMHKVDLVVLGANDFAMPEMDAWRRRGVRIIGGSPESARWESDRAYGMQIFKRAGIAVPPFREFTDYDEAIRYVKRHDQPFASKPSGHCDDKALSYVAKAPRDLVYMLERWKRQGKRQGLEFILQEKVSGIEFACGAWFGPGGFAPGFELNWEEKKLMAGGLGVNCGEMGTTMVYIQRDKLAMKVLKPLEGLLHRIGYVGNVDVNCIVDDDGNPWPLEFTMRCGWPAFNIEQALFKTDFVEFLAALADGKPPRDAHYLNQPAVGVVLAHGDFPHSHATRREIVGVPLYDCDEGDDDLHFAQVMIGDAPCPPTYERKPCLATAGDYVLIATGVGDTVQQARERAYRAVDKPRLPSEPFYRPDIGQRLARQLPKLHELGYATGLRYS
jgi:phosphoribosylamine--glycine ligase